MLVEGEREGRVSVRGGERRDLRVRFIVDSFFWGWVCDDGVGWGCEDDGWDGDWVVEEEGGCMVGEE